MRGLQVRVLTNLENLNIVMKSIEDQTPMLELQQCKVESYQGSTTYAPCPLSPSSSFLLFVPPCYFLHSSSCFSLLVFLNIQELLTWFLISSYFNQILFSFNLAIYWFIHVWVNGVKHELLLCQNFIFYRRNYILSCCVMTTLEIASAFS